MATQDLGPRWHESQLGNVDSEIARQSFICGVKILDAGVIERVIRNDITVCSRKNEKAFNTLRMLVQMHYKLADDSLRSLGTEESGKILDQIRTRLRARYDLGGTT